MKFVIRKRVDAASGTPKSHYWFLIVADNGEPVAASEMYTQKQSAIDTIAAIKGSVDATTVVVDETRES